MNDGVPVHFLHIRKAGGTAIKEALEPVAAQFGIILHDHRTKLSDIPSDHRFFFFIRHPVSRFISGFYSRLRRGMPRYQYEWTRAEAKAFSLFQEANDLAEALSSTDSVIAKQARDAMRGISHVNSTFSSWFSSQTELDNRLDSLVLLGLQERMGEDFEVLKLVLRLPTTLMLPKDEVRAHRSPAGINRTLSPLADRNLRQWYAADIRFYEHCLEVRNATESEPTVVSDSSWRLRP